jgi:hypothetical protein
MIAYFAKFEIAHDFGTSKQVSPYSATNSRFLHFDITHYGELGVRRGGCIKKSDPKLGDTQMAQQALTPASL